MLLVAWRDRMDLELAEPTAEREMLLGGDVLVVEEQHLVFEQTVPQRRDGVVAHFFVQVDAVYLAADRGTEGFEGERVAGHV